MKTVVIPKRKSIAFSKTAIVLFTILLISTGLKPERIIHGTIISASDRSVLPGATVIVKGTSIGTLSDANGQYSIAVPDEKSVLVFSFVGFVNQEVKVSSKDTIHVELVEDIKKLEEIVVVGYGTVKKSLLTGAISTTTAADMPNRAVNNSPSVAPGILTAGEINDFTKWELWKDIDHTDLKQWQEYWKIKPIQRYTLQVITNDGKPVIDCKVQLVDKDGTTVWLARTDNTGKAELWANIFETKDKNKFSILAEFNGSRYKIGKASTFHKGINILKIPSICQIPAILDAMFVVDATGSMGDELEFLKVELNDVIRQVKEKQKDIDLRLGSVFYRDHGDEYVTKKSDFSENIQQTIDFIKAQKADGGGDTPEAVDEALELAINGTNWHESARARLLFLVLDAPPHYNDSIVNHLKKLTMLAAQKGIRIIPITGSGIDKGTEYLMRAFSLATNGTYVFLTDHSRVGNHHIDPTTDTYDVEILNKLMVRLFNQFSITPDCNNKLPETITEVKDTMKIGIADSSGIKANATNTTLLQGKSMEYNTNKSLKYYPNPTSGPLTIETDGNTNECFLTDLSGKILQKVATQNQTSIEINIAQYPTGFYFLKYSVGNHWQSGKIILRH